MNRTGGFASFERGDFDRLVEILDSFLGETRARCAVLIDRDGRLLSASGDAAGFDSTAFASLAAADFAASDQLAVLLGEHEFTSLYHQGENSSMYLVDVAGQAILAALFDGRTTLGMVRVKTRTVVPELVALFDDVDGREPRADAEGLEVGWVDEAQDEIDRLFAE